jgi:hypothetical protein
MESWQEYIENGEIHLDEKDVHQKSKHFDMVLTWFKVEDVYGMIYVRGWGNTCIRDSVSTRFCGRFTVSLIGKSTKWTPKDSILIDSKEVEVIIPIQESFIPIGHRYKTVETRVAGDKDIIFYSQFKPPVTKEELTQRLQRAVDNKEHVVFTVDENSTSNGIGFVK